MYAFWVPSRRAEPRIDPNCNARRDERNGGSEDVRKRGETFDKSGFCHVSWPSL